MVCFYGTPDDNIVLLVFELNYFPGIETIGSCGGHENPSKIQKPAGEWHVGFWATVKGLETVIDALQRNTEWTYLTTSAIYHRGFSDPLRFQCSLFGEGTDPIRLAECLQGYRQLRGIEKDAIFVEQLALVETTA